MLLIHGKILLTVSGAQRRSPSLVTLRKAAWIVAGLASVQSNWEECIISLWQHQWAWFFSWPWCEQKLSRQAEKKKEKDGFICRVWLCAIFSFSCAQSALCHSAYIASLPTISTQRSLKVNVAVCFCPMTQHDCRSPLVVKTRLARTQQLDSQYSYSMFDVFSSLTFPIKLQLKMHKGLRHLLLHVSPVEMLKQTPLFKLCVCSLGKLTQNQTVPCVPKNGSTE